MPTIATVLLPASIRWSPSMSSDAKNKESLFETDEISILLPFMGLSGYPSGTAYLHTVALLSKSMLNSLRVSLPMELKISNQIIQLEWLRKDLKMDLLPVDSIPIYITLEERNINNISMDFKRHYYESSTLTFFKMSNNVITSVKSKSLFKIGIIVIP